jgi:predicted RNase H-like nuclease (RuvC/YqgF family)
VPIANDAYNAFMKAHTNMEKIQLQVAQVPHYVKDCVKIITSNNKIAIEKFVPRRLECIKQAADGGQKLSAEVAQAFDFIGQLIQQVLLAITASQGAKEKEIQAAIKAYNAEAKKSREQRQVIERQIKILQKELEDYKQLTNEIQHLAEEFQRSRNLPNLDFVS